MHCMNGDLPLQELPREFVRGEVIVARDVTTVQSLRYIEHYPQPLVPFWNIISIRRDLIHNLTMFILKNAQMNVNVYSLWHFRPLCDVIRIRRGWSRASNRNTPGV